MKEYKNNEKFIDYLTSKNVIVNDRKLTQKNFTKMQAKVLAFFITNWYNLFRNWNNKQ